MLAQNVLTWIITHSSSLCPYSHDVYCVIGGTSAKRGALEVVLKFQLCVAHTLDMCVVLWGGPLINIGL